MRIIWGKGGRKKIENMHVNTQYIIRSIHIFLLISLVFHFVLLLFKFLMKIQRGATPLIPPPPTPLDSVTARRAGNITLGMNAVEYLKARE